MRLEELEIYKIACEFGEEVWNIVGKWNAFNKNTIGSQLTRSTDSIAANIAEGYGRHFYKETKQFCYISRGSLLETHCWLTKARSRKLLSEKEYKILYDKMELFHKKLNAYIKYVTNKVI